MLTLLSTEQKKYLKSAFVLRTIRRTPAGYFPTRYFGLPLEVRYRILHLSLVSGRNIQLPQVHEAFHCLSTLLGLADTQRPNLAYRVLKMLDRLIQDCRRYMAVRNVLRQSITNAGWRDYLASVCRSVDLKQDKVKSDLG